MRFIAILLLSASIPIAAPAHRKRHQNHRSMVVSMSKWAGQGAGIGMFGGPIGAGVGAAAGGVFGFWHDRQAHRLQQRHRPRSRRARRYPG